MKSLAESFPKADFSGLNVEAIEVVPVTVAYVATDSSKDEKEIAAAIGAAYGKVGAFMKTNGLKQAGPVLDDQPQVGRQPATTSTRRFPWIMHRPRRSPPTLPCRSSRPTPGKR